jgi:hypothetical protein
VFLGKLFMFGDQGFDVESKGVCWTLSANGLVEELSFGNGLENQGIHTAQVEGEVILWAATGNSVLGRSGIGVYDPRLDVSPDIPLGYYVSNTAEGLGDTAFVSGIAALAGKRYAGFAGVGIYETTSPGPFKVRMSQYGADQRNMQKRWVQAEVHHTPLEEGQSVTVETSKEPDGSVDSWGSSTTAGDTHETMDSPADYRNPYISLILSGDANSDPLTIFDVALGYIMAPENEEVKHEWTLTIAVEGFDALTSTGNTVPANRQRMRDRSENTRISTEIKADLDLIINKEICYQDLDGTEYIVLVKSPSDQPDAGSPGGGEIDKFVDDSGEIKNLSLDYTLHLIEMKPAGPGGGGGG